MQAGGPLFPDASATAAIFAGTVRDARARGQLRAEVDADSVGRILLDAYLGALIRWTAGEDATTATLRDQFSTIVDTLINGLRPPRTTARGRGARRASGISG